MALIAALPWLWILTNFSRLVERMEYVDPLSTMDYVMACLAIVTILEATRRTVGLPMVILAALVLLYTMFGNLAPRPAGHQGHPGGHHAGAPLYSA